jgi:uncharacterized protein YggE
MDAYIEVTGEAKFVETVESYRTQLDLTVRAAKSGTALEEVTELRNACIAGLREAGLTDEDLEEGGAQMWRPWYRKMKVGQEASHRILITCSSAETLARALGSLEALFDHARHGLNVHNLAPVFGADEAEQLAARGRALQDARVKAEALAAEGRLTLGSIVRIEERDSAMGRSGVHGDDHWYGPVMAGAAGAGEVEPGFESLGGGSRDITVRCRVRFSASPVDEPRAGFDG